jgi:DNA invertase Pin-like site-specific DNA recombinase
LPVQEQAIVDFCRHEGRELVAVFSDPGVSGTLALHERPGLAAALAAVKEREHDAIPITALVVARWDRLARDTS